MERYFVLFHKQKWIVKHGSSGFDVFPDRDAAIRAAIQQADNSGKAGVNSSVVVQDAEKEDLLFRTEWSSVADHHPPLR